MRAIATGGAALTALILGALVVVIGQGSTVLPLMLIGLLLGFAALLFKPKVLSLGLFSFAALLPVEILKGLALDSTGVIVLSVSPADLIFLLLLPIWLTERRLAHRDFGWGGGHTAFAVLLLWLGICAIFSRSIDSSFIVFAFYLKYFLFFVVAADLCRDPVYLRALLWGAAAGLSLQLAVVGADVLAGRHLQIEGAKQASIGRQLVFSEAGGLRATRPSGLMNHPNSLAALLVLILSVAFAILAFARQQISRPAALGIAVLAGASAVALLATLSRGGWLALAVSVLFMIVVGAAKGLLAFRRAVAILIALAVLGAGAVAVHPPLYLRLVDRDHGASNARVLLNDQAMMMIAADPILGVGPGAYVKAAKTAIPPSFSAAPAFLRKELLKGFVHNKYLLTAAEMGLVGLALFLILLWRWTAVSLHALSRDPGWENALALGLAGGIVAQCVTYFFEHVAYDVRIGLLAVAAAIASALTRRRSPAALR